MGQARCLPWESARLRLGIEGEDTMDLTKLLRPRTVALVGASERAGFGGDTTRNYMMFSKNLDHFYLVNPKYDELFGRTCYHSLAEIPEDVDMVVICTPAKTVISLLEQAAEKNAGGAVVFASGYSEIGPEGKALQAELAERANELGIAICGPNCGGYVNLVDDVFPYAFMVENRDRHGDIGMVSQSGQIVLAGLDMPGMGFSYAVSSGNGANVKVEDYIDFLVDDADTKVVCVYMEGVADPVRFCASLRKAALKRKPVVILKTGRSVKSQELAASHTGSLSGADKVLRAMFRRYGVIEANDLEELMAISQTLSWLGRMPEGERCVFMNVSGGEAGIAADLAEDYGIVLADYTDEDRAYLKSLVPGYGTVNNPFDMTAGIGYDVEAMSKALRSISADPNVDAICISYTITPEIFDETITCMVEAASIVAPEEGAKPVFWLPYIEHTRNAECARKLREAGVGLLPTGRYGMIALRKVLDFATFEYEDAQAINPGAFASTRQALSEYDSLCYLADHGVPIPPQAVATTKEEAIAAAAELGYPLSVKIHSADIQHKSDVGGVKLNIADDAALAEAIDAIMASCAEKAPQAKLEGVLLKPMLPAGAEMIIGVSNDKDFGPSVMVGMGGVFVELFKDVQLALAPLSKAKALEMISSLKAYPLLTGYRGSEPCDVDALADLLVAISRMAAEKADEIRELDLNPVFVTPAGVAIADALLVLNAD